MNLSEFAFSADTLVEALDTAGVAGAAVSVQTYTFDATPVPCVVIRHAPDATLLVGVALMAAQMYETPEWSVNELLEAAAEWSAAGRLHRIDPDAYETRFMGWQLQEAAW